MEVTGIARGQTGKGRQKKSVSEIRRSIIKDD